MSKCVYCGVNEVKGKAKTCSSKCRMALSRSVTVTVTTDKCNTPTVTPEQQVFDDWQEEINQLPLGVVKPRWIPGVEPKSWQESRAYFDIIVTLLAHTVVELEEMGVWIPSWKHKQKAEDVEGTLNEKYRHIEIGDEHDGAVRHLPLGFVPGDG